MQKLHLTQCTLHLVVISTLLASKLILSETSNPQMVVWTHTPHEDDNDKLSQQMQLYENYKGQLNIVSYYTYLLIFIISGRYMATCLVKLLLISV